MKKWSIWVLILSCLLALSGCGKENRIENTVEGNLQTYYEMSDGTWQCGDISYRYRLEITGRLNNAACDTTFVYLSNLEDISFEQASLASGLSSHTGDYFPAEDAVLVEWNSIDLHTET